MGIKGPLSVGSVVAPGGRRVAGLLASLRLLEVRSLTMDGRATLTDLVRRLAPAARRRLGIDARALAAFRVAIGLLVITDLALRSRDLSAFHTDAGVLPRSAIVGGLGNPNHLTLYLLSGEAWFVALLFAVSAVAALALIVGYRTTTATFVTWLLLISLQNRNPLVLNGGDVLFRLLVFWALFLPLGARWSIDARRGGGRSIERVASIGSAALLLQVVIMYTANAAFKLSGDLWWSGDAILYVFSLDQFVVLLGDVLVEYPMLLRFLDHVWLAMLVGSGLLILMTGWRRAALVPLYMGMHLGMALTMMLGLFPFIGVAALVPFLPAPVWNRLESAADRRGITSRGAAFLDWLDARLPHIRVTDVPTWLRRAGGSARTALPAIFLVLIVLWNVQAAGVDAVPDQAEPAVELTRTDQYWNMFAPEPLQVDGWYVVPGRLENGSQVDVWSGGAVRYDKPPDVAATYPNTRWRKYLVNLWRPYHRSYRPYLGTYLCERYNRRHDVEVVELTVYYMEQRTVLGAEHEPIERVELLDHECDRF